MESSGNCVVRGTPAEYAVYDETRQRGPLKFKIGADTMATARNIADSVSKFQKEQGLTAARVCGVIFNDGTTFRVPLQPTMLETVCILQSVIEVHVWIRDQMGRKFEKAAHALEQGLANRTSRLVTAAFYERNISGEGARDLNRNYTNRTWVLCLTSMTKLVSALKIMNEEDVLSSDVRMTLSLIHEAQADVDEVLEGAASGTKYRGLPHLDVNMEMQD